LQTATSSEAWFDGAPRTAVHFLASFRCSSMVNPRMAAAVPAVLTEPKADVKFVCVLPAVPIEEVVAPLPWPKPRLPEPVVPDGPLAVVPPPKDPLPSEAPTPPRLSPEHHFVSPCKRLRSQNLWPVIEVSKQMRWW
jgi:hypothetical protein